MLRTLSFSAGSGGVHDGSTSLHVKLCAGMSAFCFVVMWSPDMENTQANSYLWCLNSVCKLSLETATFSTLCQKRTLCHYLHAWSCQPTLLLP